MNIPKIGTAINTAAKKIRNTTSNISENIGKKGGLHNIGGNLPKEDIIKMYEKQAFEAALTRDCLRISAKEGRVSEHINTTPKKFIDNAKKAATELLNSAAEKLTNIFKK